MTSRNHDCFIVISFTMASSVATPVTSAGDSSPSSPQNAYPRHFTVLMIFWSADGMASSAAVALVTAGLGGGGA